MSAPIERILVVEVDVLAERFGARDGLVRIALEFPGRREVSGRSKRAATLVQIDRSS